MISIRNRIILCVLVTIIIVVLTSGCLGTKTPVEVTTPPPTLVLDYQRTGGIAGVDDRLVIFDNGAALISTKSVNREFQINQSEIERIHRIFSQAEFASLEENYTSPYNGADFLQYSISYQNKTVMTEDTVIPYSLQPVVRELNAIVTQGLSQDPVSGVLPVIKS